MISPSAVGIERIGPIAWLKQRLSKSFNTTAPRSRSKTADHLTFPTRCGATGVTPQHMINGCPERKVHMQRTILIAALLCASEAAVAQELTAEQRTACKGDYEKYCKGTTPGGGRIIACLSKSSDKLTADCKKVLAAAEKK
jgi:hypothetical protein